METVAQVSFRQDFESDYSGNNLGHNNLKSRVFSFGNSKGFMFNLSLEETERVGEAFEWFNSGDLRTGHGFKNSNEIISGKNIVVEKEARCELTCKECNENPRIGLSVKRKEDGRKILLCRKCSGEVGSILSDIREDIVFDSDSFVVYKIRKSMINSNNSYVDDGYIVEIGGKGLNHTSNNLSTSLDFISNISEGIRNPNSINFNLEYRCLHCGDNFDEDEEMKYINFTRYSFHEECIEKLKEDLEDFMEEEKKLVVSCSI